MRYTLTFIFTVIMFLAAVPSYGAAEYSPINNHEVAAEHEGRDAKKAWKSMSRAERKEAKVKVKAMLKDKDAVSDGKLLLVILAVLIPPLAMGLYDGITNRFWISLLLTLLFLLPGIIYTLIIILGDN